jgi:hypothetical protein
MPPARHGDPSDPSDPSDLHVRFVLQGSESTFVVCIPKTNLSPAAPNVTYPLTARHAWQRRDVIDGLNQPRET